MNPYQKLAVFLLRFIGAAVALIGVTGPVYVALAAGFGSSAPDYNDEHWWGSIIWTIGGASLVVFARPLGRLLGRGLD